MDKQIITQQIKAGQTTLGIEFGSTNIKAVLINNDFQTIASGSFTWENQYEDGVWTYHLADVWKGLQYAYAQLATSVKQEYGTNLQKIQAIGISAMMHGYLAFDQNGKQLAPFQTWRNDNTEVAAQKLTNLFNFNIPLRWSIAHLYQAILDHENHVQDLAKLFTLSSYVHYRLTGKYVSGIGDASGMFPIDPSTKTYDKHMLAKFAELPAVQKFPWKIQNILPQVLVAGQSAGKLTAAGAKLIDPSGNLLPGALMAPPEGDAGTGMIATNSIRPGLGNISVGTSAFIMIVLQQPLLKLHREIDVVMTPDGSPVAMVHVSNCSSDFNAWVNLFHEFTQLLGVNLSTNDLYQTLLEHTSTGDQDAGGLVNYSLLSSEYIDQVQTGRPLFVRTPDAHFNLGNFFKAQLFGAFAPLRIGLDNLLKTEPITIKNLVAQGGLFKTPVVAQQILADSLNTSISILDNATVGGPFGMAVLALYCVRHSRESLADYLTNTLFSKIKSSTRAPEPTSVRGYEKFLTNYQNGLPIERLAGDKIK